MPLAFLVAGCIGSPSSPSSYRAETAFMLKYVASEVGTSELAWQQHQDGHAPSAYLDVVFRDAHAGLLSRFQGWQSTTPSAADADEAAQVRDLGERSAAVVARAQTCAANREPCEGLADDLRDTREELEDAIARWDA